MEIHDSLIHAHAGDIYDIAADVDLYWTIANDMLQAAGLFAPRSVWQRLDDAADYSTYKLGADRYKELKMTDVEMAEAAKAAISKHPNLEIMLDAWVGPRGRREELDEALLGRYREYLVRLGDPNFFDALYQSEGYKIMSDFLSVEEITILRCELQGFQRVDVLEIGGGYGRLCEAFVNVFSGCGLYVLADSVPLSLMYAYLYLKAALPTKKVGIYYLDPDPANYDCYVVPTWRLEEVFGTAYFDLAINVQSMQEMSQWHVDYYLNFFNSHLRPGGLVYLNNNKRYVFRGDWNYPSCWRLHFRHNSPWAWSADCPVEVFVKEETEQNAKNQLVNYAHGVSSELEYERLPAIEQQLAKSAGRYKTIQDRLDKLTAELSIRKDERDKLAAELSTSKDEQNKLAAELSIRKDERDKLVAGQNKLEQENARLMTEIGKITGSFSWRVTKPLRKLRRLIK